MNILLIGTGRMSLALAESWVNKPGMNIKVVARGVKKGKDFQHKVGKSVKVFYSYEDSLSFSADLIVVAVPTPGLEEVASEVARYCRGDIPPLMTLNKGIYEGKFAHNIIGRVFEQMRVGHLHMGGASFNEGLHKKQLTVNYLASCNLDLAERIAREISTENAIFIPTDQLEGLETAGALKSIGAVISGIVMGMDHGENIRALLIVKFSREMEVFFLERGLSLEMFHGPGLADLILCCSSETSNHYRLGYNLGRKHLLKTNPKKRYRALMALDRAVERLRRGRYRAVIETTDDLWREIIVSTAQDVVKSILYPPAGIKEVLGIQGELIDLENYEAIWTVRSIQDMASDFSEKIPMIWALVQYLNGHKEKENGQEEKDSVEEKNDLAKTMKNILDIVTAP